MSLSSLLGISSAHAAPAADHAGGASMFSPLIIMLLFIVVFYFILIRPQSRKRKAQQKMISEVGVGDEIVTIGGIVGRINKLRDDFIELAITEGVTMTIQKSAVSNILPKGTIEA